MPSIRDAYDKMGADYEDVLRRLMGDEMVARFAIKFLDDDSMDKLEAGLSAGNAREAFIGAHTLKGVCQNLGFDNLYEPAVAVTEALRHATDVDVALPLMPALRRQYAVTTDALRETLE